MKLRTNLLQTGAVFTLLAGSAPAALAAYNMVDYYPLSVGDTRVTFETSMQNQNGALRKSSYVGSETITGTEMVNGVQTMKLSYGKPNSNGESESMNWEADGLKVRQMVGEHGGAMTTNTCATPIVLLPAQMELGQTYSSPFTCSSAGTVTNKLEAVEDVSVEAGNFAGCLKVHRTASSFGLDELEWYCPGVGVVKTDDTDNGAPRSKQLRWASVNVNGVVKQYGAGEQTVGDIRSAFAGANFYGDSTLELYNLYQGENQFVARFALDPARIFFSYQPNGTGNGISMPGVTLGNAYVKINGNQMTIYNISVNGVNYFANWEFVTSPEIGFQIKDYGPMP